MIVVWLEGRLGLAWGGLLVRRYGLEATPPLVTLVRKGRVSFRIPG